MKKLLIFSVCLIAVLSFAFQKTNVKTTPSVKIQNLTDSVDLDAQMKVYETQMRELEKQMYYWLMAKHLMRHNMKSIKKASKPNWVSH